MVLDKVVIKKPGHTLPAFLKNLKLSQSPGKRAPSIWIRYKTYPIPLIIEITNSAHNNTEDSPGREDSVGIANLSIPQQARIKNKCSVFKKCTAEYFLAQSAYKHVPVASAIIHITLRKMLPIVGITYPAIETPNSRKTPIAFILFIL